MLVESALHSSALPSFMGNSVSTPTDPTKTHCPLPCRCPSKVLVAKGLGLLSTACFSSFTHCSCFAPGLGPQGSISALSLSLSLWRPQFSPAAGTERTDANGSQAFSESQA